MLYNVNNTYNEDMYTISLLEDVDVLLSYIDNNTITDRIEYNLAYNYCNSLIEQYITTGNDEYIESILNEDHAKEIADIKAKLNDIDNKIGKDKTSWSSLNMRLDKLNLRSQMYDMEVQDIISTMDPSKLKPDKTFVDVKKVSEIKKLSNKELKEKIDHLNLNKDSDKILKRLYKTEEMKREREELERQKRGKITSGVAKGVALAGVGYVAYKNRDRLQNLKDKIVNKFGKNPKDNIENEMEHIKQVAENKPKSWVSKKIQALRDLYSQWLRRANDEKDIERKGIFKNIARVILNCIDWLMNKLQEIFD